MAFQDTVSAQAAAEEVVDTPERAVTIATPEAVAEEEVEEKEAATALEAAITTTA